MLRAIRKNKEKVPDAQVLIEFTFCMIIIMLMIYGLIMILRWTGVDLAERERAHESQLTTPIIEDYGQCLVWNTDSIPFVCLQTTTMANGPLKQLDEHFYLPTPMNAVWEGF